MAGDWIKLEHTTPDKPEVYRLSRMLGVSRGDAFLLAVEWWIWLDRNSRNGNVTLLLRQDIDDLMRCPGFAAAMESVGWLSFGGADVNNGAASVPNFDRHNGKTAKDRALTKDRVSRKRNDDVTLTPLPEKRREEKRLDTSLRSVSRRATLDAPSDEHEAIAADRGLSCQTEFQKYRDWQASTGKRHKDEVAGFRNWLRNAKVDGRAERGASNMDILTGRAHGRVKRVDSAIVLALPSDLRESGADDVEGRGPERSALRVG